MNKLVLLFIFLGLGSTLFAQELTLLPYDGTNASFVNIQIIADTLADGSQAHSVYKVESDKIYAFDGTMFVDFPLVLEGSDNTWIYNQSKPPVFLQTPGATTSSREFFNLRAGGSITVKNILFSCLMGDDNNLYTVIENAAGDSIIADNCVFTDHDSHAIKVTGACLKVHITDCIFINGIRRRFNPNGGMPHRFDGAVPDILLENNTSVNSARLLGNGGEKFTSNMTELHCTYLNQQVNAHELHWYQALQANNIFYNWSWRGRQRTTNGYETVFTTFETFANVKSKLDSISIYHGRNLLYLDPVFTDFWKNEIPEDSVLQCLLWNIDVDSTVEADNNFTLGKNYWQFNPMFTTAPSNTDSMLAWDRGVWAAQQPVNAPDWRVTPPITYDGDGNPVLNWPPPFDLSYSSNYLQKAGTDGLPLGDLNWFPTAKATYMANRGQYIAALKDSMTNATSVYIPGDSLSALITPTMVSIRELNLPKPDKFYLAHNYPNPFNPTTTIKFGLPEQAKVKFTVYNLLGQKVFELKNDKLSAGVHSVNFDASKLSSGIYVYRINAEGVSGKTYNSYKKMTFIK